VSRPLVAITALSLAGVLIGTLLWFPAASALRLLPPPWACQQAEGTVWRGRCGRLVADGREAGEVAWRWQAVKLLRGELAVSVRWTRGGDHLAGQAVLSGRDLTLTDLRGLLDTGSLRTLPVLPPVMASRLSRLDGQLRIGLAAVEIRGGRWSALRGTLDGGSLAWQGRERWDLGDLRVTFAGTPAAPLQGDVVDLGGPLEVRATLRLDTPPAWGLSGTVRARDPVWTPRLAIFGAPDAQGRHTVSVEGR
jgi:hypothetical protein